MSYDDLDLYQLRFRYGYGIVINESLLSGTGDGSNPNYFNQYKLDYEVYGFFGGNEELLYH